jgi:hypothetical protein
MADLLRVSIFGQMPGGEEWSVNPVYQIGGDFGTSVSQVQCQTVATAIAAVAVPTGLHQTLVTSSNVQGVRVEARTRAGGLEVQAEATKAVPQAGTGSTAHPYQTSLVISLRTALPGASGRGRMYWPATGIAAVATDLRLSAANATSVLAGAKTYLSSIETAIEATLPNTSLVVWSRKTAGLNGVISLQLGNIFDVQRRRRDVLIESYSSTTWP